MAYDLFTQESVFVDQSVNVLCNRIFNEVTERFLTPPTGEGFALTGTVAKILQGAPQENIKVIPFITDSQSIWKFCNQDLGKILKATSISFSDRIQMVSNGVYIEIWLINLVGTINLVNGIACQDPVNIPVNIN